MGAVAKGRIAARARIQQRYRFFVHTTTYGIACCLQRPEFCTVRSSHGSDAIRMLGSTSNAVPSSNWLQMFRPCVRVGMAAEVGQHARQLARMTVHCSAVVPGIGSVHAGTTSMRKLLQICCKFVLLFLSPMQWHASCSMHRGCQAFMPIYISRACSLFVGSPSLDCQY